MLEFLRKQDPQVAEAIRLELGRQRDKIELIASENFVSRAVMEAMGTVLTNKYAEGYPGAATTAAASMWTSRKTSPVTASRSCSGRSTPTCSLTPGRRPTWRSTLPS